MDAPPGSDGPQLSPDGHFWWDGSRWVPMAPPVPTWQAQPYRLPAPSPGLRPFLIVVLVASDVLIGLLALIGILAALDYLGLLGGRAAPADPGAIALIVFFIVLFALMLGATVQVVRRGRGARVLSISAGLAVSLTCLGLVLGIPIILASIRAPMTKTASVGMRTSETR